MLPVSPLLQQALVLLHCQQNLAIHCARLHVPALLLFCKVAVADPAALCCAAALIGLWLCVAACTSSSTYQQLYCVAWRPWLTQQQGAASTDPVLLVAAGWTAASADLVLLVAAGWIAACYSTLFMLLCCRPCGIHGPPGLVVSPAAANFSRSVAHWNIFCIAQLAGMTGVHAWPAHLEYQGICGPSPGQALH
jgi:hypothetical protein